jgi:hypothetical protein
MLELRRSGPSPLQITTKWVKIEPKLQSGDKMPELNSAAGIAVDDDVYIFGGASSHGPSNTMWRYKTRDNVLEQVQVQGSLLPSPREMLHCGKIQKKLFFWGGRGMEGIAKDMFVFDTVTSQWMCLGRAPGLCAAACTMLPLACADTGAAAGTAAESRVSGGSDSIDDRSSSNEKHSTSSSSGCAADSEAASIGVFVSIGGSDGAAVCSDVLMSQPLLGDGLSAQSIMSESTCEKCRGVRGWNKFDTVPSSKEIELSNDADATPSVDKETQVIDTDVSSLYQRMAGAMCPLPIYETEYVGRRKVLAKAFLFGGTSGQEDTTGSLCVRVLES